MKIAFVGKGGSGKTTLSSLFAQYLAARGLPVVAIDADISQHLAEALAASEPRPMGIEARLDTMPRDWAGYASLAAEFHQRNARFWASDRAGEDLTTQIDPDLTLGPHTLAVAV